VAGRIPRASGQLGARGVFTMPAIMPTAIKKDPTRANESKGSACRQLCGSARQIRKWKGDARRTHKPFVGGSSPPTATILFSTIPHTFAPLSFRFSSLIVPVIVPVSRRPSRRPSPHTSSWPGAIPRRSRLGVGQVSRPCLSPPQPPLRFPRLPLELEEQVLVLHVR